MLSGIPWVLRDMMDILDKHGASHTTEHFRTIMAPFIPREQCSFSVFPRVIHWSTGRRFAGGGVVQSVWLCREDSSLKLKARCDRGKPVDASAGEDVQNVASLLKMFLRELPQAVIPDPQRVEISRCFREFTDELTLNHMLREQLTSLPKDNYNILSYLCHFLLKVASYSQVNHMSVENLATIFGPCLFQVPYGPSMLEEQTLCNAVVCHILKNQSFLMSSGLDSPSPPPVLTALSHPEEKAMGCITSVWSSVHESSAETQALDTAETQGQCSASPSLTHIQLAGDEVSRQCVSAVFVSKGQDDAAETHTTTPRSDRAAVSEDQLGSGQNQILKSEKTTSFCDPACDHRLDFPQVR
ncbi:hypothetical protein GJAV_G00195360 [Gymnothorax javanicus]|nr:hypothetical protein GJAV_G00195360 [Gymnothorax javanicus]